MNWENIRKSCDCHATVYIQYTSFWPRSLWGWCLLANVTQITTMPTTKTTIVARIGTSTSGSNQALSQTGISACDIPFMLPPGNGDTVPKRIRKNHIKNWK